MSGKGQSRTVFGERSRKGHGKICLIEIGGGAEWRHSDQWELACLGPPSQGGLLSLPFLSPSHLRLLAWLTFNVLTSSRRSHSTWWSLRAPIHISEQRLEVFSHL